MRVDLAAARQFLYANARLLDCHRAACFLDGTEPAAALTALRAYRNPDGGFGHGLEPDVRSPRSETTATLQALEIVAELGWPDDDLVAGAHDWTAGVAGPDGGVPFVLAESLADPHGPWMRVLPGGSHLTFGFAALLGQAGVDSDWVRAATAWSWARLADPASVDAYSLKYALMFLDHTPERDRAERAVEGLRGKVRDDGSVAVPGGTEDEKLTVLTLSPRPATPSRALFTPAQVAADLDALASGQHEDGGWSVDYAPWSAAQAVEWRGIATLLALRTLRAHGRC